MDTAFEKNNNETKLHRSDVSIPEDLFNRLVYLGIISLGSDVRSYNVGESKYATSGHLIQPWTIWLDYPNLTPFDDDIIKRVLREKDEPGISLTKSRIKDYKKIIHICEERIRQLTATIDICGE